jgi:hypothetical protein
MTNPKKSAVENIIIISSLADFTKATRKMEVVIGVDGRDRYVNTAA